MKDYLQIKQRSPKSSSEEVHAKTYLWLDIVKDWAESVVDCSLSNAESLTKSLPRGLSGKMSSEHSQAIKEETSQKSSITQQDSVPKSPREDGKAEECVSDPSEQPFGACLTLKLSESHKDAEESFLSQVLESWRPELSTFYLSPKAARGILRRAEKRDRKLPERLKIALEHLALEL